MTTNSSDAWAEAFEDAHRQATASHTVLLQGYAARLSGALGPLDVAEGRASALVTPRHEEPCQAHLHVAVLSDAERDAFTDALSTSRYRATVERGHLPPALLSPDAVGDVALAPGSDQISFTCACRQAPCQHTAALGHALTQHLRAQPADWLILRGLPPGRLIPALSPRDNAAAPSAPSPPAKPSSATAGRSPAVVVSRAYLNAHHAYQAESAPLPRTEAAKDETVRPLLHRPGLAPPPQGPSLAQLRDLTTEAARQASALLADGTFLEGDPVTDAVRRIAALPAAQRTDDSAYRLGLEPATLRRLLTAYSHGGPSAVHTALHPQPIPPEALSTAITAITPLRPSSRTPLATDNSQITDTALGIALRYGPDARWYPFGADEHDWECLAASRDDAATAYRAALAAKRSRARASARY
ncbi:hypothetical protein OG413_41110 [Streptomyces sp. NBC_01433]|uniref:hypothetical protein n=1 Tax=Streptomyces sp. NBC_01433 TaxID=2903864 RepID=UPI00224FC000|nr:hypothetical protein [Streptomyces sp. NBC_01433]MCX4681604.1 hypothetical protein [Streptomyces sp. NBC_01433]